jgi:hypothetical protein
MDEDAALGSIKGRYTLYRSNIEAANEWLRGQRTTWRVRGGVRQAVLSGQ